MVYGRFHPYVRVMAHWHDRFLFPVCPLLWLLLARGETSARGASLRFPKRDKAEAGG